MHIWVQSFRWIASLLSKYAFSVSIIGKIWHGTLKLSTETVAEKALVWDRWPAWSMPKTDRLWTFRATLLNYRRRSPRTTNLKSSNDRLLQLAQERNPNDRLRVALLKNRAISNIKRRLLLPRVLDKSKIQVSLLCISARHNRIETKPTTNITKRYCYQTLNIRYQISYVVNPI